MARVMSFAESGTASKLPVFTPWELKKDDGSDIDAAARPAVFQDWAKKMLMDHLGVEEAHAVAVAKATLQDNSVGSCFELDSAYDLSYDKWKQPPEIQNLSSLKILHRLAQAELRVAQGSKARVLAQDDTASSSALISAMVTAQCHGKNAEDLSGVPGLEHHLAETKRIKKARQLQRLKEEQKFTLKKLVTGACSKFSFLTKLDNADSAEDKHPKFDLRKDLPLWGDSNPAKTDTDKDSAEQMGLATLLAKVDHFLTGHLVRGDLEVVHCINARYQLLFLYRKLGRDIGLAWFQEVLDELHRRSETEATIGDLKSHLEKFDSPFHDSVLKTLEHRFPKKAQDKGSITMKEVESRMKALEAKSKQRPQPAPQAGAQQGRQGRQGGRGGGGNARRSPSRSRSRARQVRTPPQTAKQDGGGEPGAGLKRKASPPEANTPALNKAFSLALAKSRCPHHQKGICSFGDSCRKEHACIICDSKRHGAASCPELKKDKGKKLLG